MLALEQRPDLMLKVESRLQAYFDRRLRLAWDQNGLGVSIVRNNGATAYYASQEASGILHIATLLAAMYHDEIGLLCIDEPEISLHPQFQAFIRDELISVAGDPHSEPTKKLVVVATHSPAFLQLVQVDQLPSLITVRSPDKLPIQLSQSQPGLNSSQLSSLLPRLGTAHRMAFFASHVVLVEGPSDEIIAEALARHLDIPLAAASAQIVPINGKGDFPQAIKLFLALGKEVTVLADLDAFADENTLVTLFGHKPEAGAFAGEAGHRSLSALDRAIRSDFAQLTADSWGAIASLAQAEAYWDHREDDEALQKVKIRAAMASLLANGPDQFETLAPRQGWRSMYARLTMLIDLLARLGCFFLKRGTIESYYKHAPADRRKPVDAGHEAATFGSRSDLSQAYPEAVAALRAAAQARSVDENLHLRAHLGRLLGHALLTMTEKTSNDVLNSEAYGGGSERSLFRLSNHSADGVRKLQVELVSPLFTRDGFPFLITESENPIHVIRAKLP